MIDAAQIKTWRGRCQGARFVQFFSALVFIALGALTAHKLYGLILIEANEIRTYFSWLGLNKLIPLWPGLVVSGIAYYISREVREHYELLLEQHDPT